jgi:hypothetical protein
MTLQEPYALSVGIQEPAPGRATFKSVQDCIQTCDDMGVACSGITVLTTVKPTAVGPTCAIIKADTQPGVSKRTMIRADLDRLIIPSSLLCPSGYTPDAEGLTKCTPVTTPAVVSLFLRAPGSCSDSLTSSVRTSLYKFLSNPDTAYGELCWEGRVAVMHVNNATGGP